MALTYSCFPSQEHSSPSAGSSAGSCQACPNLLIEYIIPKVSHAAAAAVGAAALSTAVAGSVGIERISPLCDNGICDLQMSFPHEGS